MVNYQPMDKGLFHPGLCLLPVSIRQMTDGSDAGFGHGHDKRPKRRRVMQSSLRPLFENVISGSPCIGNLTCQEPENTVGGERFV